MSSWGFVGRARELERLVRTVTAGTGRGLIVSGAVGVGKSRLLRQGLAAIPTDRYAVHAASANTAVAGLPLGGLAQILPADPPRLAGVGLLRWAVDSLHHKAAGRPVVLAVDDAHLLDDASAALVYLMAREGALVLATVRSGEAVPGAVRALWSDDLADHVELPALRLSEAAALLAELLGGPVEPASVERLWRLSSGNALLLRELVLGVAGSEMTRAYGVWRWTGRLDLAPTLVDLVDARIGRLDDDIRTVVELVALGEPVGLDLLIAATDAAHVEAAEERGLIRVTVDDRRSNVRVGHPLYGEVVRRRCPVTRTRRLQAVLADLVEGVGGRRRDDNLRVAVWRLDSGTGRDPGQLLAAGAAAFARLDVPLSGRLVKAAVEAGGGYPAVELLATLLMFADKGEQALATLDAARPDGEGEDRLARWSTTRAMVGFWALHRPGAADELAAAAAGVRDPAARARMLGFESVMRLHRGDCAEAQRLARTVLDRAASPVPARALALSTMAYLHALRGEFAACDRAVASVEADTALWRDDVPSLQVAVELAKSLRLALTADLAGIDAIAEDEFAGLAQAGDFRHASGSVLLLRAHAAALRGRSGESLRVAVQACAAFATSDAYNGGAHAARAYAAALRGDAGLAAEAIADADRSWVPTFGVLYPEVEQARAWATAAAGDCGAAVEQLCALGTRLRRDGFAGHELLVRYDLVRLGRPELAIDDLIRLAGCVEGPLSSLFLRHARTAVDGDADALLGQARAFAGLGLDLFAAEAAAAAVERGRVSREPSVQQARALLADVLERCETLRTPALAAVTPALTARERQIAGLAAAGASSRDIADRLFLSTRTVDNHLQRVYAKLGVSGRGALAPALRALPG